MGYTAELRCAKETAITTIRELGLNRRERTAPDQQKSAHPLDTVTEYDRRAEDMIVEELSSAFDYRFLTEEGDREPGESAYWCIDPIDGTTNFSRGYPPWGVSIALVEGRTPLIGVVVLLPAGRMFSAIQGEGSYVEDDLDFHRSTFPDYTDEVLAGDKISVSDTDSMDRAMIKTAANDKSMAYDSMVSFIRSLEREGASVRNNGCCTADLCHIAEGALDGRANANLERWDVDAARLILSEAGGQYRMRRRESGKLEFIASNGLLQDELEKRWDSETTLS